jgi:hypothetical protein
MKPEAGKCASGNQSLIVCDHDPVDLLRRMRQAQRRVAACPATDAVGTDTAPEQNVTIGDFLTSLGTAWQAGEVRPTHRRKAQASHDWRTRTDPFEHTWPKIQQWLETEPAITAKQLQNRLIAMAPTMYSSAQLRTLQRRVKTWRSNRARELVTRILGEPDAMVAGAATQRQPPSLNNPEVTIAPE